MTTSANDIVSIVILNRINPSFEQEFENWQIRIGTEMNTFNGFIGVSNKKVENTSNEYFTLFQFDTSNNLKKWQESNSLKGYLDELKKYTVAKSKISKHEGLEIFFGESTITKQSTPYYKKLILGIIAVYPLIILIEKLYSWLNPWPDVIPFEIGLFLQVILVSALLTYPVMPILVKLFRKWLTN